MSLDKQFQREVRKILEREERYAEDAYYFVQRAVRYTQKLKTRSAEGPAGHISCKDLLSGIRRFSLHEFGPLGMRVFAEWGIHNTEDFGNIVFEMAEQGILGISEDDRIEEFRDIFDFHDVFVKPFMPSGKTVHVPVIDDE